VAEFVDDGISGTAGDAARRHLMLGGQFSGRAWQTILVWDIKRFGRMPSNEPATTAGSSQAGVEIVYTSEGFTGTSADKFLRFFKQEAARDESATLSKAVIRGLVSLADASQDPRRILVEGWTHQGADEGSDA
jgi:hypothetical protein